MDRTLQERIRLEVDKEIQSCGFYNIEIQQVNTFGIYIDLLL